MRRIQAQVTEAGFQQAVIEYACRRGWRCATFRPVRVQRANGSVYYETPVGAQGKGWPDLALARDGRLVCAELKVGRNRPTAEQLVWLGLLERAGVETFVWYPESWPEIERVLQ